MPGLLFRMWPPISRIRFNIIKNGHSRRNISKFFKITMSNTMSDMFFTPYCNPFFVPFRKYESPTEIITRAWASATDRHPLTGMSHSEHHSLNRHGAVHQPDAGVGGVAVDNADRCRPRIPPKPARAYISVAEGIPNRAPQPREGLHIIFEQMLSYDIYCNFAVDSNDIQTVIPNHYGRNKQRSKRYTC